MSTVLGNAVLRFSAVAFGSRIVPSEEVDAAFDMPAGKLRHPARILSLTYVSAEETEGTRAARAAAGTVRRAPGFAERLDAMTAARQNTPSPPSPAAPPAS